MAAAARAAGRKVEAPMEATMAEVLVEQTAGQLVADWGVVRVAVHQAAAASAEG